MPDEDYVAEELEQARTALTDATILHEGQGSNTAVLTSSHDFSRGIPSLGIALTRRRVYCRFVRTTSGR